jgi:hypothetical protein
MEFLKKKNIKWKLVINSKFTYNTYSKTNKVIKKYKVDAKCGLIWVYNINFYHFLRSSLFSNILFLSL